LTSLIILLVLSGAIAPTVLATPLSERKARLREVKERLEEVAIAVETAVERYNQAASDLATTRGKIEQNTRRLHRAEYEYEVAERQLTARARSIYKAPDASVIDVIFSARSFDDLVAQFDLMRRLGDGDVDLVHTIAAYEREIRDRRIELKADERVAEKLLAERKAQRAKILASEQRMRRVERGLRDEIEALLAQQRAAAEAAVAAAGGGASTSAPPPPDPGGPGRPEVVAIAQRYLGVPYVWGGASPSGFDCSGLTMYVYAQIGIQLAHGATAQQRASTPVPLNALLPGDLVFYGNASYSYHVALYVGGGQVIEAPRTGAVVSYDGVDNAWIGGRF
jgi:cell wall-associated NlpC family hydrolase